MAKRAKVYFLTAYVEYLFDQGIRSEEYYVGDASRYMRWLLGQATEADLRRYIQTRARSKAYRARLQKTLSKFIDFAVQRLDMPARPMQEAKPEHRSER